MPGSPAGVKDRLSFCQARAVVTGQVRRGGANSPARVTHSGHLAGWVSPQDFRPWARLSG